MQPVDQVLRDLGADHRSPAPGEWGLTLSDVAGWPLHVGLREHAGLLRVQAEVCSPEGAPDAHWLLHRSRLGELVRYTHSREGAVWVQCEVPVAGLDAALVDRVLSLVVVAAEDARQAARRRATSRART